jgi:hypothetical protein
MQYMTSASWSNIVLMKKRKNKQIEIEDKIIGIFLKTTKQQEGE